jgi:hypothetical protein
MTKVLAGGEEPQRPAIGKLAAPGLVHWPPLGSPPQIICGAVLLGGRACGHWTPLGSLPQIICGAVRLGGSVCWHRTPSGSPPQIISAPAPGRAAGRGDSACARGQNGPNQLCRVERSRVSMPAKAGAMDDWLAGAANRRCGTLAAMRTRASTAIGRDGFLARCMKAILSWGPAHAAGIGASVAAKMASLRPRGEVKNILRLHTIFRRTKNGTADGRGPRFAAAVPACAARLGSGPARRGRRHLAGIHLPL